MTHLTKEFNLLLAMLSMWIISSTAAFILLWKREKIKREEKWREECTTTAKAKTIIHFYYIICITFRPKWIPLKDKCLEPEIERKILKQRNKLVRYIFVRWVNSNFGLRFIECIQEYGFLFNFIHRSICNWMHFRPKFAINPAINDR